MVLGIGNEADRICFVQVGEHAPSRLRVGSPAGKLFLHTSSENVVSGDHLPKEVIVQGFCGATNDG